MYYNTIQDTDNTENVIENQEYSPPTISEFYSDIEERRLEKSPNSKNIDSNERKAFLKQILNSHESHLWWLITAEAKEKAYATVTQLVIDAELLQEKEKKKAEQKDNYTTSTKPHTKSVWEDIFVYNNWTEILAIESNDRATHLYKLIDNRLFIDEWTSAWNRTMIVYNLDNQSILKEIKYYWQKEINENDNTLIYATMTYDKPENSETTCWEQEWYFQKHSFNYKTLKSENSWDIYCSYVE